MHCVVTGGGLAAGGTRWVHPRPRFLVSVRVLSRLFRRLFLQGLQRAYKRGELTLAEPLRDPDAFHRHLQPLKRVEWVVYMKPPFGSAEHVIEYLGRYTHRVAIGEHRLLSSDNGQIRFLYKDYGSTHPQQARTMTVSGEEFVRRFLLHVLPEGFQRIRHYGLLSNRSRAPNLALCRALLLGARSPLLPSREQLRAFIAILESAARCPVCKLGWMIRTFVFPPQRWRPRPDTS